MPNNTPISKARTYQEIGAFWDEHDATEFGDQTKVDFDVDIKSQHKYYPLEGDLSLQIRQIAKARGMSEEMLLKQWVQEKIDQAHSEQEVSK